MSGISTRGWHERAHQNMGDAANTHQAALNQAENSVRTHEDTVNKNHDQYRAVQDNMELKVSNTRRLVETLSDRAYCLENSIQHTRESLGNVEAANRAKDGPLQLCLWRIEQRTKRPYPREQVRDDAEVALEDEKATLIQTKWDLSDAAERTKDMIRQLEARLAEVRDDLHHKKHALGIDEMCLSKAQASFANMAFKTPRPQGPPTTRDKMVRDKTDAERFGHAESHNNEMFRVNRTGALERHSASHDEAADILREANTRLIARCEQAAKEAKMNTDRCLRDRLHELQHMRMRIEDQIRETESKIDHTNGIIAETRYHMGALQEPLAMQGTCAAFRKDRTAREHITDPVAAALAEHQDGVLQAHEDLAKEQEKEKAHLKALFDKKKQLEDDLKDKSSACSIDSRCLNHGTIPVRGGDRGLIGPVGEFVPLRAEHRAEYTRTVGMPMADPGISKRTTAVDPVSYGRSGGVHRGGSNHTHQDYNAQGSSTAGRGGSAPGYATAGRTMNMLQATQLPHATAPPMNNFTRFPGGTGGPLRGPMTPRGGLGAGTNPLVQSGRAAVSYG